MPTVLPDGAADHEGLNVVGNGDADAAQDRKRLRSLNGDAGELVADVGDFDVVHDDEFVEDVFQALGLPEFGVDEQVIAEVVNVEIALYAALRIQDEVVVAVILREVANIIGDHAVGPADTVGAGEHDLRAPA